MRLYMAWSGYEAVIAKCPEDAEQMLKLECPELLVSYELVEGQVIKAVSNYGSAMLEISRTT